MAVDRSVRDAWTKWLSVTRCRCHINYRLEGRDLEEHIELCAMSARETAQRIDGAIRSVTPDRILEVGCSVGFNCLELARQYPTATLVGLEPDNDAVRVGDAMARQDDLNIAFVGAKGERLPFRDGAFDLIICHTVIEHVENVELVIAEMVRVLAPGGTIHLEAPNYLWPREPHLEIWCVPWLGRATIRLLAKLQGKGQFVWYLDHLQFVTPRRLERLFRQHHLIWENRTRVKLHMIAGGQTNIVKAYQGLARMLQVLRRLGVARRLVEVAVSLRLYPSVQYTASRVRPPSGSGISS